MSRSGEARDGRDCSYNLLSGEVRGGVVQAAEVHGDIVFHNAPSTPVPVPRQLLAAPDNFTDRRDELTQLAGFLGESRNRGTRMLAVLSGPGGIGKTALALQWAHDVGDLFGDGQLYVDLAGFSGARPVLPEEALGLFLRGLGVPPREVPADLAEQAALYRSLTADKKLLVLLDNACSAAQVRPLAPNSPSSAVLVTSRSRLTGLVAEGARLLDVGPLATSSALRLLAKVVGRRVDDEPDPAKALVRMCGGLPIAVRVAAARLATRPKWSVRKVLAELGDERRRLSLLSAPELSVQTTFDLSYRALHPPAATLYRRLGLHPGQEFGASVAASVLDAGEDPLTSLEELVDGNLVESVGEGRYRFHDLLRLHARNKADAEEGAAELDRVVRRMVEWYLMGAMAADRVVTPHRRRLDYAFTTEPGDVPEFADRESALAWLEEERPNLIACGRVASEKSWWELSWQLADVMWPLLLHKKHYRDRLEIDERGVEAGRRWGNAFAEWEMLKRLGMACTTLGRYDEARTHLGASAGLARSMADPRAIAAVREASALLQVAGGDLVGAAVLFADLAVDYRGLAENRGLGLTLINLGGVLSRLDRTDEAMAALDEAEALLGGLVEPDPYNAARVVVARAEAHLLADRPAQAERAALDAVKVMDALGSSRGSADSHRLAARALERSGRVEEAAEHWALALRLYRGIDSSRAAEIAQRLERPGGDSEPPARDG
ncbi:ATP-binding protein [Saccharothrix longispora]|uniref:ATP-binding protein n=1 Tax=Saccharothrix longispora TaxID=33920 RepID=UPI0028FD4170|nr:NB-ARC domain-containing protein [Saccharothrix longispora]MDU0291204.1 NB-ARC domain-containing protein [Saccharothrix longispora]